MAARYKTPARLLAIAAFLAVVIMLLIYAMGQMRSRDQDLSSFVPYTETASENETENEQAAEEENPDAPSLTGDEKQDQTSADKQSPAWDDGQGSNEANTEVQSPGAADASGVGKGETNTPVFSAPNRYAATQGGYQALGNVLDNCRPGTTVVSVIWDFGGGEVTVPAEGLKFFSQAYGVLYIEPDGTLQYVAPRLVAGAETFTDSFQFCARDASGNLSGPVTVFIDLH